MTELTEEQKKKFTKPNRDLYFVHPWDKQTETPTRYPESMYELDPYKVIDYIEQLLQETESRAVFTREELEFIANISKEYSELYGKTFYSDLWAKCQNELSQIKVNKIGEKVE